MTLTNEEFLSRVNYELRGTDDDAPTIGDDDANFWLSELQTVIENWANDPNQKWKFNFVPDTEIEDAVVAAAKPSWNLPANFIMPSDEVEFLLSDGTTYREYDVISPEDRSRFKRQFYVSGSNPQKLYCTDEIVADDMLIGAKLYLPGYYAPEAIDPEDADQIIPLPDANYGVMAVAAKVSFSDITYEDKFNDLNGQANVLYRQMAAKNRRGTRTSSRKTPTRVPKIRGYR